MAEPKSAPKACWDRRWMVTACLSVCVLFLAIGVHHWTTSGVFKSSPEGEYDYIIVGAGSAGSVLARRLTEKVAHQRLKILVLESGGEEPWFTPVPLMAPLLQQTSSTWGYKTEPQKHAHKGMLEKRSQWPLGRTLGGSGALNFMIHNWGIPDDFDSWNFREWTYRKVEKYFRKIETFHRETSARGSFSNLRGQGGLIQVTEFNSSESPLCSAFLTAAAELGLKVGDLNGEIEFGASSMQATILQGKRSFSGQAYLRSALKMSDPPNDLDVVLKATVNQLVIDESQRVVGVKVNMTGIGKIQLVRARKEVILSAGTVGTPKILLMSGIGPAEDLEPLGIPMVLHQSSVGQHLMDHLFFPLYFHLEKPISCQAEKLKTFGQLFQYLVHGKGYLSWTGAEAVLRAQLPNSLSEKRADIYIILFNMGSIDDLYRKLSNLKPEVFSDMFPETGNEAKEGFILLVSCVHPLSEGDVKLRSADPSDPPIINPNYLSRKEDLECLKSAALLGDRLTKTTAFRDLGVRLHIPELKGTCPTPPPLPPSPLFAAELDVALNNSHNQSLESLDQEFLECWIRSVAMTNYHPVGTCKMGTTANDSVVDQQLRLHGIDGLRIVDASILPGHISGPTNAVTMMLAERGAEMILNNS